MTTILTFIESTIAVWDATPWQMQFTFCMIILYEYTKFLLKFMSTLEEENTNEWTEKTEEAEELPEEFEMLLPKDWVKDQIREIWIAYGLKDPYSKTGT